MIKGRKNSLNGCLVMILPVLLLLLTSGVPGNYMSAPVFDNPLTVWQQDTTKPGAVKTDTIPGKKDSLANKTDTFNLKISKDSLDAPVHYTASDSMVLDAPSKKIILYGKGNMKYKDIDLSAENIELDQPTKIVTATFRRDSAGNIVGRPVMLQADTKMESDIIKYNFNTQKGITQNTYTNQGELFVQAQNFKKAAPDVYYGFRGRMTTCNLDTPHFAFRTNKMKMVSKKLAITGPVHPEFEGVPVPIYLPFGFFPLSQGRHSGILPPTFTASDQFGLGLEGLGYYKVLNEFFDVTVRTNLYSYGGWTLFVTPTYRKRYRYNGTLNFSLQNSKILSEDAKQEFFKTKTFNITWSHTVDSRARPGTSFSANVNAGSTKFNQYVTNNPIRNYSNQLSSSITYSKTWTGSNLTVTANHNQNNNSRIINLNIPNISYTANTLYPFQPKDFAGEPKWYQKLGVGLNSNITNQVSFLEEEFSLRKLLDTIQWGAQHSVPIQLSLPPLGPLQISPGISYQEKWYSQKFHREWNNTTNKVDTTITKGFYSSRDISFSLGLSTALFGTFNKFGKNSSIIAIRHVIRPTFSLSYKPDLAKKDYYYAYVDSSANRRLQRFSYFDGSIFGPFGEGTFGGISFGIDNNIEAKFRSKKDTTNGGIKKVRLIDGFGFNGGYNYLADSFKLSTISIYLRSTLFEKINLTAGATLDPYQVDSLGFRIDKYTWQGGKRSPGRITSGNVALSTSFQSKQKDGKEGEGNTKAKENALNELPPLTPEEQLAQLAYVRQNPAEFADFNVAWSLSISFSLNFSRNFRSDYKGFETTTGAFFNWNGDFNLTPKWKLGMSGYYDVTGTTLQSLTMFISREMHCWQLSINVTPVGIQRSFNITINPKSGILRDLRINRTRYFYGM